MKQHALFIAIMLTATASVCSAGTINKGVWSPSGCGREPMQPKFNQTTVDGYNKSVDIIDKWQEKVNEYSNCVVTEANNDNASIVKYAEEVKQRLQKQRDKVTADTEAAKGKLEKAPSK